ncbi:MAG TPA: class II glutamine amidotransferase [Gaiellaceae bacterium]|nr:class II glutamine amidotransferase [Gaiellaceae bacterium]
MCGIAGYSIQKPSSVERTLAAQALLAAIAERGADAVGYAYRAQRAKYATVVKQRTPASELLDRIDVPADATQLLVHVRDYTKGHPSIAANNHPVRHGPVVGIHNGIITNDDELLAPHSCARCEPRMTVDSEAIFCLAAHSHNEARALESLEGAMAAAWMDEREPGTLYVARGAGRPLWVGEGRGAVFFASTESALTVAEDYTGIKLRKRELREGTMLALRDGAVDGRQRFRPDLEYVEADPLPAVRAPGERESCLQRLAVLAAAA